ncbi:MAG: hypothetical protein UH854_04370 [Clostridia bacterium]|nr:hypothetical protein [Clostridia bacterium]
MREKISAFIKFIAVIVGFLLAFWGICGAYGTYFGSEGVEIAATISRLVVAVIGAGIAFGGVVIGNIVNR